MAKTQLALTGLSKFRDCYKSSGSLFASKDKQSIVPEQKTIIPAFTLWISRLASVSRIRVQENHAETRRKGESHGSDGSQLHMNAQGYALWTSIIRPVLLDEFKDTPAKTVTAD